jgi:glycosyltransferase involved in cell wall biosynthesis
MNNHPQISIIIPVYNAELYINSTIESVLNQTYTDFELILIDDGSQDNSPVICDRLSSIDSRCRVVHQENRGVSSARNRGLDEATGDWIYFVDSDDAVPNNSIELLLGAKGNADYIAGSISADGGKSCYPNQSGRISVSKDAELLLNYITSAGSYSPYAKLFKRSIIEDNNIRFDEDMECSEDALFIRKYILYCDNLRLIPNIVYYYNKENSSSLSKKKYSKFALYFEEKLKVLLQLMDRIDASEERKSAFISERAIHGLRISTYHYLKDNLSETEKSKRISDAIERFRPWIKEVKIKNAEISAWWGKHKEQISAENKSAYITSVKKELRIRNMLKSMKLLVQDLIGRKK